MRRIIDFDIYGLLPIEEGFLYIKTEVLPDGKIKGGFFGFDAQSGRTVPVKKWTYFHNKFGAAYQEIASQIKDYVTCECDVLSNGHAVLLYPDGDLGIFNGKGTAIWTGELKYKGEPVRDVAADGKNFWSVVPSLNAIICFAADEKRVQIRIGGGKSTAFAQPVSLKKYGDSLFICNAASNKVRTIALNNYAVSDYLEFDEPIEKYFIASGKEFVMLKSGLYML